MNRSAIAPAKLRANLDRMRIDEYAALDAVAIAAAMRAGELSALEVTEAAIGAINALEPRLNAMVLQDFAQALEVARGVSREAPLAGVPFPSSWAARTRIIGCCASLRT